MAFANRKVGGLSGRVRKHFVAKAVMQFEQEGQPMPKFIYSLLILSVGCLCGGARASDNVLLSESDPFYIEGAMQTAQDLEPLPDTSPGETFDGLAAKAREWSEPSQNSEIRYVYAIRKWLSSLNPDERAIAQKILREAHPRTRALRVAIREKKSQLAAISFDHHTRPETLPRLGQELQALRAALRQELKAVDQRLRDEAGIPTGPLGGDGFWLAPLTPNNEQNQPTAPKRPDVDKKGLSKHNTVPLVMRTAP